MLVARWGILWRPLQFATRTNACIIEAAMKLHNLCIDHNKACIQNILSPEESENIDKLFQLWINTNSLAVHKDISVIADEKSVMKQRLVREIDEQGECCPSYACPVI